LLLNVYTIIDIVTHRFEGTPCAVYKSIAKEDKKAQESYK